MWKWGVMERIGQRDEQIKGRMRKKQGCRVIRVKIMKHPQKAVKMETLPLCLSKMGPPVVPNAVSLPLPTAINIGGSGLWMINYCSELFSKFKNLLLNHSSLKKKY